MRIKIDDFNLKDYVTVWTRISGKRSFNFKRNYLTALPYIEDDTIDIQHSGLSERFGEWKLILRLGKNTKTFYIRNRAGMRGKIGSWPVDPDMDNLPPGMFTTLAEVEDAFAERVKELNVNIDCVSNIKKMTIREYATGQYIKDRSDTAIKNGDIKPVTDGTIQSLITGFPNWIDKKIEDANKEWPLEFQTHWKAREFRCTKTGQTKVGISTDTMRRYYTALNALFNMCVKKDYLARNPIDGRASLYPRNPGKKKVRYNYEYEEAIDFIFDESEGNQGGKIIIATMILCGARNSEVYKNYRDNFDVNDRSLHIPGHISKNKKVSRDVMIENDRYWDEIERYISVFWESTPQGLMFPSSKSASGHVSDGAYKPIWRQVKDRFNLPTNGRLYDNRHTFCSRLARETSLPVAAQLIGDSIETTMKYYIENELADSRGAVRGLHNKKPAKDEPDPAPTPSDPAAQPQDARKAVRIGKLPTEVEEFLEVFSSGKEFPGERLMYDEDWQSFTDKISKKVEKGRMGEDAEEWLEDVT